jgi:hypothetical protein
MIFKLTFDNGRIDWCTAKDQLHLLKSYDADFDLSLQEIESIDEISEDEAKIIMVRNTEFDEDNPDDMPEELSIWELSTNDVDFKIVASTEFD